ncbi:MAG TPA: porin, partial [Nitrospiraceae bacterium]|nr:porin [Nitrospiraceae bacterium]
MITIILTVPGWAIGGTLEDLMLEKGQMTIDEWVELKAEEERREAKIFEESRGVGDTPVKPKWYEKISVRGYAQMRYNRLGNPNGYLLSDQGDKSIGDNQGFFLRRARVILSGEIHERLFVYIQPDFASTIGGSGHVAQLRDWYADFFLTKDKEWRIRAGQSKV